MVEEDLPDHLRCRRNDGRQWRCVRRVMDNSKLCELHYLQARRRQYREKVPDSMKLHRKPGRYRNGKKDLERRNLKTREKGSRKLLKLLKKRGTVGVVSEALCRAWKKMKKGDLRLELIRMFVIRQLERKTKRSLEKKNEGEFLRDLPNGLMAISPAPVRNFDNAGLSCERKLGLDSGSFIRRCFRSKNVEMLPLGSLKIAPYGRNVVNLRRDKKCHQFQRGDAQSFIRCSGCRREYFCNDCMKDRESLLAFKLNPEEEIKLPRPVCHNTCNCKTFLATQSKDGDFKDLRNESEVDKIPHLHYLVCHLLPVVRQINQDQRIELEIEAKIKGKVPDAVSIQQAKCNYDEQLCCDKCKTFIVDFHRSCSKCSYDLCLSCCHEIRRGNAIHPDTEADIFEFPSEGKPHLRSTRAFPEMKHRVTSQSYNVLPDWKTGNGDGSISCPPKEHGGCGDSLLDLKCVFPLNWTEELEISAEEIVCSYDFTEPLHLSSHCSLCINVHDKDGEYNKELHKAAAREDSDDNYLYCPSVQDFQDASFEHFQKHWSKGQPVIVRDVLKDALDLSWDPIVMFYGSKVKLENNEVAVKATDCFDWCEVEIELQQFLRGYLDGRMHANMWPEMLTVKDWPCPEFFQEHFPAHNAYIIHALPFQEYTNPNSGLLNLAAKFPKGFSKTNLGPYVYISYGTAEELGWGDSVTKLHYDSSDVVNILAHATEVGISPTRLTKIRKLKKCHEDKEEKESQKTNTGQRISNEMKQESSMTSGNAEAAESSKSLDDRIFSSFSAVKLDECDVSGKDESIVHGEEHADLKSSMEFCTVQKSSETIEDEENFPQAYKESSTDLETKVMTNSCGAQWDVFRREDVSMLKEYLRRHSNEFRHTYCSPVKHVSHPILDQSFFLNTSHKKRLKEEFKVEPWTFKQHLGEAVIVPAGCPYQIRNLKSCVNVTMHFVSLENVTECIKLNDELRLLPPTHKAREDKLEVKKMSLHSISAAITEIQELMSSLSGTELKGKL